MEATVGPFLFSAKMAIRTKRKKYDPETKPAAMAALLAGQSVSSVAKEYKIPPGTAMFWNSEARAQIGSAGNPIAIQKRELLGTLIIEGLEANLKAGKVLAKHFENPVWLNQQSAEGLAVLYGVLSDKAVRLLEALSPGDEAPGADTGQAPQVP